MKRTPQERVASHNAEARAVNDQVMKSPWGVFPAIAEQEPHDPKAHRNLSGVQFRHYPGDSSGFNHSLNAKNSEGKHLGSIKWNGRTGRVNMVYVEEDHRGLGVGTALWERANKLSEMHGTPMLKHSPDRTIGGDDWAKAVGGTIPKMDSKRARQNQARRKAMGQ
jgi:GNAT superfamily N-acetyltransferase